MIESCIRGVLLVAGLVLSTAASELVVARVNGESITLRMLEDEILGREGVAQCEELVFDLLSNLQWKQLKDDAVVVSIGPYSITRRELASLLIEEDGAKVRREMINIKLVEHALAVNGIDLTSGILARELDRHETTLRKKLREQGKPDVDFTSYLQVKEEQTVEEYMQQPGFRMAAGLHELVHRLSEIAVDDLKDHMAIHFEERFVEQEAVSLSLITIPFKTQVIDGVEAADPDHQHALREVMQLLFDRIRTEKSDFITEWKLFGASYDREAQQGHIGWVNRHGKRLSQGADVPVEVLEFAFQVPRADLPTLLPPIEHVRGIDIARVEAYRVERRPTFIEARDAVRIDYIETHLEELTNRLMQRLHREAQIDYDAGWSSVLEEARAKSASAGP